MNADNVTIYDAMHGTVVTLDEFREGTIALARRARTADNVAAERKLRREHARRVGMLRLKADVVHDNALRDMLNDLAVTLEGGLK